MNHRRLLIILAGLALLSAAFLLLNFRVAMSRTLAENSITTTSIGDHLPDPIQRRDKITLVILGSGPLDRALRAALLAEFRKAGLAEVELAQTAQTTYPNPVLLVKAIQPGLFWTPFFATGQFTLQTGYVSNGDTRLIGDPPAVMDNRNGPALHRNAAYQVKDQSWGLLTYPGYHQLLAEWSAKTIVEATKDLYLNNQLPVSE